MDDAKRQDLIKQMQQIIFEDAPYLVTSYQTIGEAVRSDRFACLEPQPNPGGIWLVQYGSHNYLNVRPASEAAQCDVSTNEVEATAASEERRSRDRLPDRRRCRRGRPARDRRHGHDAAPVECRRTRMTLAASGETARVDPQKVDSQGDRASRRGYIGYVLRKVAGRVRQPVVRGGPDVLPVPGPARRPGPHAWVGGGSRPRSSSRRSTRTTAWKSRCRSSSSRS